MKTGIVGRLRERKQLNRIKRSKKSEFVAVFGRRRVGKTFLIREHFKYKFDFQLTGLANANTEQQLANFQAAYERHAHWETGRAVPENWFQAFLQLTKFLETIGRKRKKVIFLDELPWLDTARSDFMMALEHFWNSWASARKDIILITCGSAASWMINKLINNRGGLHNRVTERIHMFPFVLRETEELLRARGHVLDRYQIIQIYMVTGGIPFYLDALSPEKSAWQNIEDLCFRPGALLALEFPNLFNSLFKNARHYENIVTALSSKTKGLSRKEITRLTGLPTGGSMTRMLRELEASGFITSYLPFGKKSRNTLYRLSDFYTMFYLRWLKDGRNRDAGVWVNAQGSPAQNAWAGYTFEQVCLGHIPQIKRALGISGIVSQSASWKSTTSEKGAQVDLLIDRSDHVINLCEIKFSTGGYQISKAYATNLRNKIQTFRDETKTRKAIFLTMITTYGVEENTHANSIVLNSLTMDDLFT